MNDLKAAHKTILEVYSVLINLKPGDSAYELYDKIREAVEIIENNTMESLSRMEDES